MGILQIVSFQRRIWNGWLEDSCVRQFQADKASRSRLNGFDSSLKHSQLHTLGRNFVPEHPHVDIPKISLRDLKKSIHRKFGYFCSSRISTEKHNSTKSVALELMVHRVCTISTVVFHSKLENFHSRRKEFHVIFIMIFLIFNIMFNTFWPQSQLKNVLNDSMAMNNLNLSWP